MTAGSVPALLGRDAELAVLTAALGRAAAGEPVVVTIDGPAGIGKSALLQAFASSVTADGRIFWLRCARTERDVDFAAVELLLGAEMPTQRGELGVARELLSRLDDIDAQRPGVAVLIVDDAHWMDVASTRALSFALRRLQVESVLTIVSRRPGIRGAAWFSTTDPARTIELRLAPLTVDDVIALAHGVRGWALTRSTAQCLVELTGGLPLLIDLVLRRATEPAQLTSGDIPVSAFSETLQLLESLDPESRRLVEAAAVVGEPASHHVLRAIAHSSDGERTVVGIAGAVGAGLLVGHPAGLRIPHVLLAQAVYDSVAPARRRRLHRRAARWTTGSRRLEHRASASDSADAALAAELEQAAETARADRRYAQAAVATERARMLVTDDDHRDRLLLQALIDRVAALDLAGAARLAPDAEAMPPSALRSLTLGRLRCEQGLVAEADAHLRHAIADAAPGPGSLHARASLALAVLQNRLYQGSLGARTLTGVHAEDDPDLDCDIVTNRAISLWLSGDSEGAETVLASRPVSPPITPAEAELLGVRGMVRHYTGELRKSLDDLDASIGQSSQWRPSTNHVRVYLVRARSRFQVGDWDGAVEDAAAAHAIASGQTDVWNLPLVNAAAVLVPAWRGQWEAAQRHLDEGRAAVSADLWKGPLGATLRLSELQVLESRGDRDALMAALEPMLDRDEMESLGAFRSYMRILPPWIAACVEVGRLAEARRALAWYEEFGRRRPRGPEALAVGSVRSRVALAEGDIGRARRHLASDLADQHLRARPFQLARVHHAAGRLELVAGDRGKAAGHFTQAIAGFTRLGATPLLEQCLRDLDEAGGSPASRPAQPAWGLSERESIVAAFVRRGFTNKEIARELFVTAKAVEYHLTRIYAKVGVRGRYELRQMLTTGVRQDDG